MGVSMQYFSLVLSLTELTSLTLPIIGPLSDHFGKLLSEKVLIKGHVLSISIALVVSGFGIIMSGFGKESYARKNSKIYHLTNSFADWIHICRNWILRHQSKCPSRFSNPIFPH
jgi:hypothetical protein